MRSSNARPALLFLEARLSLFIWRACKCVIKVVQVVDSVPLGNIRLLVKLAACVLNVATKMTHLPQFVQNVARRLSLRQDRDLKRNKDIACVARE